MYSLAASLSVSLCVSASLSVCLSVCLTVRVCPSLCASLQVPCGWNFRPFSERARQLVQEGAICLSVPLCASLICTHTPRSRYVHSFLGLGATEAQESLQRYLAAPDHGIISSREVTDPCLLLDYRLVSHFDSLKQTH